MSLGPFFEIVDVIDDMAHMLAVWRAAAINAQAFHGGSGKTQIGSCLFRQQKRAFPFLFSLIPVPHYCRPSTRSNPYIHHDFLGNDDKGTAKIKCSEAVRERNIMVNLRSLQP